MGQLKKSGIIVESTALPNPIPSSNLLTVQTLERYSNHLGAVDNFTQTGVAGNGAVTSNAATHDMTLASGINLVGHARWESKKTWNAGTFPLVATFIVNTTAVAGANREVDVGFSADFTVQGFTVHKAVFAGVNNTWFAITCVGGGLNTQTVIASPNNGDILAIVVTTAKVDFYLNGLLWARHTTNLPTTALKLGAAAYNTDGSAAAEAHTNVDMMDINRYTL